MAELVQASDRHVVATVPRARRRYLVVLAVLSILAVGFAFGLLAWDNPMPLGSDGFWRIANLRTTNVVVMLRPPLMTNWGAAMTW